MPYSQYELIGKYNTLNQGRIYINDMYTGQTMLWSSGTGSDSIIRNNVTQSLGNQATAANSMAGGIGNIATGTYSIAFWGQNNRTTATLSSVLAGKSNINRSQGASIVAGFSNSISASSPYSLIINGSNNVVDSNSKYATIINGKGNRVVGNYNLVSGFLNTAWTVSNAILGGRYNSISGATTPSSHSSNYWADNAIIGGGGRGYFNYGNALGKNVIRGGAKSVIAGGIGSNIYDSISSFIASSGLYNGNYTLVKNLATISGGSQNSAILSSTGSFIQGGLKSTIISSTTSKVLHGTNNVLLGSTTSYMGDSLGNNGFSTSILSSNGAKIPGKAAYSAIIASTNSSLSGFGGTAISNSAIIAASNSVIKVNTSSGTMQGTAIIGGNANLITVTGISKSNVILGGYYNNLNKYVNGGSFGGNSILGGNTNKIQTKGSASTNKNNLVAGGISNTILGTRAGTWQNNTILGGSGNTLTTRGSTIIGSSVSKIIENGYVLNNYSFIGGGKGNQILSSNYSVIHGGKNNKISYYNNHFLNYYQGTSSAIVGGGNNTIGGHYVISSSSSYATNYGGILAGKNNSVNFNYSAVIAGSSNVTNSAYSGILAGLSNVTNGKASAVIAGRHNNAAHNYSVAMGGGSMTRAAGGLSDGTCQLVIGNQPTLSSSVANNRIRLDAKAGQGVASVSFVTGTADYAEYFEWLDNNITGEDRKGYFVSLVDDKIEIGNSNIIGIVSSAPGFIGDAAELSWDGLYAKDEWNKEIIETYKSYSWTESENTITVFEDINGRLMTQFPNPGYPNGLDYTGTTDFKSLSAITGITTSPQMNPSYDPNSEYTPRSQRKEWAPVGLLGKLHVRTAESITSKTIDVNEKGFAINGTKYMVLNTVRPYTDSQYGIVRVFFK